MGYTKRTIIRGLLLQLICLLFLSCGTSKKLHAQRGKTKQFVVVLDAGHGGKDAGACANHGREKDINLAVALRVGKKISQRFPNVKVLYTRKRDVFIGLKERARFANRNKADLFISIHTNSAKSRSASGIETYVLGLWRTEDNLRVAMQENKSILLEDNYKKTYQDFDPSSSESYIMFETLQNKHLEQSINVAQAIQNELKHVGAVNRGVRQAGFLVIRETAMPSILIELGFITNRSESRRILSKSGQNRLASAIVKGFGNYYRSYNKTFGYETVEHSIADNDSNDDEVEAIASEPRHQTNRTTRTTARRRSRRPTISYRIQILASKKKISKRSRELKGERVRIEKRGRYYCYTVAASSNLRRAKQQLKRYKRKFKGAYIIVYKNNKKIKEIHR